MIDVVDYTEGLGLGNTFLGPPESDQVNKIAVYGGPNDYIRER